MRSLRKWRLRVEFRAVDEMVMKFSGAILGYDPGGNSSHGVAICRFVNGLPVQLSTRTCEAVEDVISLAEEVEDLKAIGTDTLTCWSTATSGRRPADLVLRARYKPIIHSITAPNSLAGSMGLNGMGVLLSLRNANPELVISETHPKVLYFALAHEKYDYANKAIKMDQLLSKWLKIETKTENDHEWDAAISVLAAFKGLIGVWPTDLHNFPSVGKGRLIKPCGETNYWWPQSF